jgi:hypothetical protein
MRECVCVREREREKEGVQFAILPDYVKNFKASKELYFAGGSRRSSA